MKGGEIILVNPGFISDTSLYSFTNHTTVIILDPKKVQVGYFCAARFPTGTFPTFPKLAQFVLNPIF